MSPQGDTKFQVSVDPTNPNHQVLSHSELWEEFDFEQSLRLKNSKKFHENFYDVMEKCANNKCRHYASTDEGADEKFQNCF